MIFLLSRGRLRTTVIRCRYFIDRSFFFHGKCTLLLECSLLFCLFVYLFSFNSKVDHRWGQIFLFKINVRTNGNVSNKKLIWDKSFFSFEIIRKNGIVWEMKLLNRTFGKKKRNASVTEFIYSTPRCTWIFYDRVYSRERIAHCQCSSGVWTLDASNMQDLFCIDYIYSVLYVILCNYIFHRTFL